MNSTDIQPAESGTDLAGSQPIFPSIPGQTLGSALHLSDFSQKRLLFNRLIQPGQVHVYQSDCRAGERLRIQSFVPVLPMGGAVVPSFALIAQSLPYSADADALPVQLPAGFNAVVAPSIKTLPAPVTDMLTRANYYPGSVIDTRTLVGGRCYIVVWNRQNQMGKYVMQVGHRWPLRWTYWAQIPRIWWQIRGWFGLSRAAAYAAGVGVLFGILLMLLLRKRPEHARTT